MMNNTNGVIQLDPGMGKTVIAIYMISEKRKKSLIIVHRESLVSQWKDRFKEFTNFTDKNIGLLSSSSFQEDLQKPVVIGTIQTFLSLLNRNYKNFLTDLYKSNIGILVMDEVHTTVGAPSFSKCSLHIPAGQVFGLSATPYRYDGNTDIINYHLGETIIDKDSSGTMNVKINVLLFDYDIDIPRRYKYLNWEGVFQRSRYLSLMKNSEIFINVSKSLLKRLRGNRNFLYVCERIKLIDILFDWLHGNDKSKFISGVTNKALEKKIVFSTPGKIRDGVDAPWKDALIMTSPISNIAQITGRIVRSNPGKQIPLLIDMVDIGCRVISSTFFKRREYYVGKGWEIKYIFIMNDGNSKTVDEKEAIKLIRDK